MDIIMVNHTNTIKCILISLLLMFFCISCGVTLQKQQGLPDTLIEHDKSFLDPRYSTKETWEFKDFYGNTATGTKAAWEFHDLHGNITTGIWYYRDCYSLDSATREYYDYVKEKKRSGHLYVWWDLDCKRISLLESYLNGKLHGFLYVCYPTGKPHGIAYYKNDSQLNLIGFGENGKVTEESFIIPGSPSIMRHLSYGNVGTVGGLEALIRGEDGQPVE
jgi:hypothetical protein